MTVILGCTVGHEPILPHLGYTDSYMFFTELRKFDNVKEKEVGGFKPGHDLQCVG